MTTTEAKAAIEVQAPAKPEPPAMSRPLREIITDLRKVIPPEMLKTKKRGGTDLTFIPWYNAVKMLDWYAPGWTYEIRHIAQAGNQTVIVARITIAAEEGYFWREATGIEEDEGISFGDTSSNAESMALRRAASKFGLGLYLYNKK